MSYSSNDRQQALPNLDFIAGLVASIGTFLWVRQNKTEIPVFQLKMHAREQHLLDLIKRKLGLNEEVHSYTHQGRHYVILLVRSKKVIEGVIIPALENRLFGYKQLLFKAWVKKFYQRKLAFSQKLGQERSL